jgi:hypothetical protein
VKIKTFLVKNFKGFFYIIHMSKILAHVPSRFEDLMITNYHLLAIDAKTGEIFRFPLDSDYEWVLKNKKKINDIIEVELSKEKRKKKNIFCIFNTHDYVDNGTQRVKGLYNNFKPITRTVKTCVICGKCKYKYNKDIKLFKFLDLEWIDHIL